MSLGNENDTIIPNTVSPIRALAIEANDTDDLANFIRRAGSVAGIVWGRVAGVPLEQLVDPSRISSQIKREETEVKPVNKEGFYASLVGPER